MPRNPLAMPDAESALDERRGPPLAGVELFSHGADIGVRGRGASLEAAFVNAALALSSVIANPLAIDLRTSVDVHCEAPDLDVLLVCWLNEIVYAMSVQRMLFGQFEVEIKEDLGRWSLAGRLTGETTDPLRHQPAVEVKGATFTELAVRQEDGAWCAQCVVDV